jgi:hypothetical protein
MHRNRYVALAAALIVVAGSSIVHATPYASGITLTNSGTTVNYIMNEDSDVLQIKIGGGSYAPAPDGAAKGPHQFTITAGDTFSIQAERTESGFLTNTGGTIAKTANGLAYDSAQGDNGALMSTLSNPLTKFNSPRGVSVSQNPNAPNFGRVYISNSAPATNTPPFGGRTANPGDGVYALNADQTDAYGYGDTAQGSAVLGAAATANTPYKLTVASSGEVYVAGFGDAISGVWRMPHNLSTIDQVLNGTTGPGDWSPGPASPSCGSCLPVGQNHGSVTSVYATGSSATGDLVVYTIDEDMTAAQLTRANASDPKGTDNNKVWKYNIGSGTLPYSAMPTAVTANSPIITAFSILADMDRGADGKFYLSQNRSQPANTSGVFVTDANGNTLFDSRLATAALRPGTPGALANDRYASTPAGDFNHDGTMNAADYVIWRKQSGTSGPDADANNDGTVDVLDYNIWKGGNSLTGGSIETGFGDTVNDLYSNVFALAVSPDQKWLATLHNNNTILVTPLVSGIPDVANRLAISIGSTTISARDVAWDAAGNLHMVSSGQGQYLVLGPGGHTQTTLSWTGSTYAFNSTTLPGAGSSLGTIPEPGSLLLAFGGLLAAGSIRRRR